MINWFEGHDIEIGVENIHDALKHARLLLISTRTKYAISEWTKLK